MIATGQFTTELDTGWEALRRGAWTEARAAFAAVIDQAESAEAYEDLAWAAFWLLDIEALFSARERAYQLFHGVGDLLSEARVGMWIASDHIDFRGDDAVANGWMRRARRALVGLDETPEHGWLAAHEGFNALLRGNDVTAGREQGAIAAAIGRRSESPELEAVGMAIEGLALVTRGQLTDGMPLLDEAAAMALAGRFAHLWAVPWTTCCLIYACERVNDLERAAQWCRKVEEFSASASIDFAWGLCRAHHAGVLVWQGAWNEAEQELGESARVLERSRPLWGVETTVRLAELRRRQGRLHESESLFTLAEGHPLALVGMGELSLDRGDLDAARDFAERTLRRTPSDSRTERLGGLQVLLRALVLGGDHLRSRAVLAELDALAEMVPTSLVRATASFCAGVVALGSDDLEAARRWFEDAVDLYARAGVPYEEARARLELARANAATGRPGVAAEQAERASLILTRLGASHEAERASRLFVLDSDDNRRDMDRPTLTSREQQVLALVAQGMTDGEIASSLALSRHTVHRHVGNILTKTGSRSRAAAVANAVARNLLEVPTG